MTFTVQIDVARWREHHKHVLAELPGLVPVAKGNGYGIGNARLAQECAVLGVDTIAVGTDREAAEVEDAFDGDMLVLTPVDADTSYDDSPAAARTIHTISHLSTLQVAPPGARVVIECRTSMNRHGIRPEQLPAVVAAVAGRQLDGFALHLPLDRPRGVDPIAETTAWIDRLTAAGLPTTTLWVSHLEGADLARLRGRHPGVTFRPRIGTRLWLGDRDAVAARGTVLDVEPLSRGERSGYRQHRAPSAGHLVVVSGGTAHGVALEAPKAVRGSLARAKVLALGTMEAIGRNLSPFSWAGRQRWFVEPPHMQVSLIFLPHDVAPPSIGDELDCAVRLTTTHPDVVRDV
ncbi:MAG: alanine racemase [Sporichthyaceae bacterium]